MAMAARSREVSRAPVRRRPVQRRPRLEVIQGGKRPSSPASRPRAQRPAASRRPGPRAAPPRAPVVAAASRAGQASHPATVAVGLSTIALSAVFVLLLVLMNVYVAQVSFKVNELQQQVGMEQNKYREMRYKISMAQSPARLAEAGQRLGLVAPVRQESLEGRPAPIPALARSGRESDSGAELKALLVGSP